MSATRQPIVDEPIYYRTRMGKFANTIHNVHPIFNKNKLVGSICFVRDFNVLTETLSGMRLPESQQRLHQYDITFDTIIGQDPAFTDALNAARMAANTPSPVMLYGETGTGKELFARAIHNHSPRHEKKYTPVNCAAIPENLLEGILFGTSKGAFTGSINKAGLFERTSQGTIFLDEINSMPVGLQSKILRIVQEGKVRRVGALKEIKFDLKIISSVNQDPHISITSGSLRADLFYRLGVVFIHIVPLRDRPTDLPLLVAHFIAKHNKALGRQVRAIDNQVMDMFGQYQWPGNVRELEHVIEGAMNIMGQDDMIRIEHLQPHFTNGCGIISSQPLKTVRRRTSQPQIFQTDETENADLLSNKNEHEKKMVWQALMQYRGNVTKVC
ncbi:MAG: sigma 54-interacting transcriptional regulator [Desulfotignum sp.]|nr:sigma 54-interacting transcriptional regulator [Desulfotignum sp.]